MAKKQKRNKEVTSDGRDMEFSQELADQEDLKAQKRSHQADSRAKKKKR